MVRSTSEEEFELRRGPWTVEEDSLLIDYITCHGEGRWNLLAQCSGLKRTGKSCRLRWLNYLKPDIKRGNLTTQEQLLILQLHSRWGNRWSKIAQHLPGRTDNEIKNYWRTRVQKQARHLKIESNSSKFIDAIRCVWIPRLQEQMEQTLSSPKMEAENTLVDSLIPHHLQAPTESSSVQEQPQSNGSSGLCFSDYRTSSHLPEIAENQTSPALDSAISNHGYYVDSGGYYDVELNFDEVGPRGCWFTDGQVGGDQWISDSWSSDELWQF